jgi:hypothetical protein
VRQYETDPNFKAYADAFVRAEAVTGFPSIVGLAIGANESGWFDSVTGDFNCWGITRDPETGPAKFCLTHEDLTPMQLQSFRPDERDTAVLVAPLGNGRFRYSMSRWFASFASIDDSVKHYIEFFTQSPQRYKSAWQAYQADHDATALLKGICEAGYATGPAEAVEIQIIGQSNIAHALEMARASQASVT